MKRTRAACLLTLLGAFGVFSAIAQEPEPAPTAILGTAGHWPEKAPAGFNQNYWDRMRRACSSIAQKREKHQPMTESDYSQAQSCMSLSVEVYMHSPSPSGYHQSPEATPATPSPQRTISPQSGIRGSGVAISSAGGGGPVGTSFSGGGEHACGTGE